MEKRYEAKVARSLSAELAARAEYEQIVHNPPRLVQRYLDAEAACCCADIRALGSLRPAK